MGFARRSVLAATIAASLAAIAFGIMICIYPNLFGEVISLIMGIAIIFVTLLDAYAIFRMMTMCGRKKKEERQKRSNETAITEIRTK